MGCNENEKPEQPPYFYLSHGIAPTPGNDWKCVNGGWEWRQTDEEIGQSSAVEADLEERPYTPTERDMYSTIVYNGKKKHVYTDSQSRDYFIEGNEMFFLLTSWWQTYEGRQHGEWFIKKRTAWKTSPVGVYGDGMVWDSEEGELVKKGINWPSFKIPDFSTLKMPAFENPFKLGTGLKAGLTLLLVVLVGIACLVALGYSGLGGAAGKAAEKRV